MFLSYDKPQGTGNDSYNQNRTKIDPRFRLTSGAQTDVTAIKGFSATGETIYHPGRQPAPALPVFNVSDAIETIRRQLQARAMARMTAHLNLDQK